MASAVVPVPTRRVSASQRTSPGASVTSVWRTAKIFTGSGASLRVHVVNVPGQGL